MADESTASLNGQITGKFDSPPEPYEGYIAFPSPMTYAQFNQWWSIVIAPSKGKVNLDFEYWDSLYKGALMLLSDYGEWVISGPDGPIPIGHLKDGNIPLVLAEWVAVCSRAYIFLMLDPKKSLMLRTRF